MTMYKRQKRIPVRMTAIHHVYPFLITYIKKNKGLAPTLNEVAEHFGKTAEWVRFCYKALIKLKKIKVKTYKQRGVIIIDKIIK